MGTFISTIHNVQLTMIQIALVQVFVLIWALTKILVWDGNTFNYDLMMTTLDKMLRD